MQNAGFLQDANDGNAGFAAKLNSSVRNYVNVMQDFMQNCYLSVCC